MGRCHSGQSSPKNVNHPQSQIKTGKIVEPYPYNPKLPQILSNLQLKLQRNENFTEKLERILMPNYNPRQKEQVYKLLYHWSNRDVLNQDIGHLTKEQFQVYYKQIDILSARVYQRTLQMIERVKNQSLNADPIPQNYAVRLFLQDRNLQISYDRYLFTEVSDANSKSPYHYYQKPDNSEQASQSSAKSVEKIIKAYMLIAQCKLYHLKKLFQFLVEIGIFVVIHQTQTDNIFIQRLERIGKKDQKKLYINSMQIQCLENIIKIQRSQQNTPKRKQQICKLLQRSCVNYHFYLNHIAKGERSLHTLFEGYDTLEQRHDYVQWMFPNHYQSAFNSQALPMNYLEKRLFLDEEMGLKMLVSIYIFFDFLGVRLDLNTFELSMCDEGRFHSAIVVHTHNHLRIMRILACLSIVGFRIIALKLIAFLDQNTRRGAIGEKYRHEFEKSWQIYGEERDGTPKPKAKAMCFLEEQQFPSQHCILKKLADKQQKQPLLIDLASEIAANEEPRQQTYIFNQQLQGQETIKILQKPKGYGLEIQIITITQQPIPASISSTI